MLQLLVFSLMALSGNAFSATDLGKELQFKSKPNGQPSFGVIYTYDDDPDGTSYMLTFISKVSATEGAQQLRWNYYQRSTDSFLLPWSKDQKGSLAAFQVKLSDEKLASTIEKMILSHRVVDKDKEGDLFFVLADDKNKPVYFIPISKFCSKYPDNFTDLSYSRRCDSPKL